VVALFLSTNRRTWRKGHFVHCSTTSQLFRKRRWKRNYNSELTFHRFLENTADFSCWKSTGITHRNEAINIVLCCRRMMRYVQPKVDLSSSRHSYVKVTWCHVIMRAPRCSATELVIWSSTRDRQTDIQCESKKSPLRGPDIFHFFTNGWEFLINFLHTYYRFSSTLDYKFLFNYPQFWRSYAIFSTTT